MTRHDNRPTDERVPLSGASRTLGELYMLWDQLRDVPTLPEGDTMDTIELPFLHFPVGTHREDIWHWFEDQNRLFVAGNVMQGIRVPDCGDNTGGRIASSQSELSP